MTTNQPGPFWRTTPDEHYAVEAGTSTLYVGAEITNCSACPAIESSVQVDFDWNGLIGLLNPGGINSSGKYRSTGYQKRPPFPGITPITLAGKYAPLSVFSGAIPPGPGWQCGWGINKNTVDFPAPIYVNVYHTASNYINLTAINGSAPPPSHNISGLPGQIFTVNGLVQDVYGNICNSSYDGKPYVSTCTSAPLKCNQTITVNQKMSNSTGSMSYTAINCSNVLSGVPGTTPCIKVMTASDEGKFNFSLYAYPYPAGVIWDKINNTIEGADVTPTTVTPNATMKYAYYNASPSLNPLWFVYNYNLTSIISQMVGFRVVVIPSMINVGENFTINVSAVLENGSVCTNYSNTTLISLWRLPRQGQPLMLIAKINLTNGTGSYFVNSTGTTPNSLYDFNKSGVYIINASDLTFFGNGTLSVSVGAISGINVTQDPLPVFRTLPFNLNATVVDIANNPVNNYTGQLNISCPLGSVDPPNQNAYLNNTSTAIFTQIANTTGTFNCNASALDVASGILIKQNFSIHIVEPDGCVNFSIPPNPITAPPLDNIVNTSNHSPVNDVMKHNDKIGNNLIGWDPATKTMKGNYSICLENYYNGRACFNKSDIQFDKAPVSVCVKEFVYNPQADDRISDHINYNGVDDLDATFKHPEVVWGWGYKNFSGTVSECGITNPTTKYTVEFTPGAMYQDYFNITVGLPLTVLPPYNITNITVMNPHELLGFGSLLVLDQKNNGRLARFEISSPYKWLEDYNGSITGSNAQAITYDNRGNIYVALTNQPKILVLKLVRSYGTTIQFIKEIDVVTKDGKTFFPYGLDTDSWGNLYVVGNTDPDMYDNQMCVNIYSKDYQLNLSNNCCDKGDCNQYWEGTVKDIAAQEDGGAFYIARDKTRTCNWGLCYWIGYPIIGQYNSSNPSQKLADISIYGNMPGELWNNNPGEYTLQAACTNYAGTKTILDPIYDKEEWHYLRGLKYRSGYLFILDYMAPDHRTNFKDCEGSIFDCTGCCIPFWPSPPGCGGCMWCKDDTKCNHCGGYDIEEWQKTRIIVMDLSATNKDKPYIARTVVEGDSSVATRVMYGFPIALGLQIRDNSYLTHGIDVDENFNVYIALKGKNQKILEYTFRPGVADATLNYSPGSTAGTSSFIGPNTLTTNVTQPDDVAGYPDIIKQSMMAGVSCEGCSREGSVEPSVCQGQIESINQTSYTTMEDMLSSGGFTAGTPALTVTSPFTPVYRQNFLTTNITAFLRFDYTFKITDYPNNVDCGGGSTSSNTSIPFTKQLNITSSSNNLSKIVEGGGQNLALTRPNYPEPPPNPPDTLPYLSYDYLSNRFFYKHYPLIQNVSELMNGSADKNWMINASYRKTFQTMENGYYLYQYIATIPTVTEAGPQGPIYNPQGNWTLVGTVWKWSGDVNASQYLNPDNISAQFPQGTVPLYNTMNWSYPFKYNFSPVKLEPNPLPFTPQDQPPPATTPNYEYWATTNVSMLQVTIVCNDTSDPPNQLVFTQKVTNNTPYTVLGSCHTITGISIAGASAEAYVFIVPSGLPQYDGICFESVSGLNESLCASTRAWFRDDIYPNTVVSHTSIEKYIPTPTRYPLIGEPYSPLPSSLFILPAHLSGPTMMTIEGTNGTVNYTSGNLSKIQGFADLTGVQILNPLPLRGVDVNGLYFRADGDLTLGIDTTHALGATIPYLASNGWVRIAGSGLPIITGDIEKVRVVTGCEDGCLLEFSNDSNGANLTGQLFLWKNGYAYGNASNVSIKDPIFTSMPPKGGVQVVPADPMNRNFVNITSITGQGYLGDSFEVYVDPQVILGIDNLTAGNCTHCTTDADCPGGACNGVWCEFPNVPNCGEAEHAGGLPCQESFVCPDIELSLLNESLKVYSDQSHAAKNTQVTIVGTDTNPALNLITGTATLNGAPGLINAKSLGGQRFSDVYIVEVKNAIKGETLTFITAGGEEVARLSIPTENYISKLSIGTILPNPRRLRISSTNSTVGRTVHYTIKGTRGNTFPVTEDTVGTFEAICPLTGPSVVQSDSNLAGCDFLFDSIPTPVSAGTPFNIKITAVPHGWTPPLDTLVYPNASKYENRSLCGGSPTALTGAPDGAGTCFTTGPQASGYWDPQTTYPFTVASSQVETSYSCGGAGSNIMGVPNTNYVCIGACWNIFTQDSNRIILNTLTPGGINVSGLNITIQTSSNPCGCGSSPQPLGIRISNNPNCFSGDANADWGKPGWVYISNTFMPQYDSFSPPTTWYNNNITITVPQTPYQNISCIGIEAGPPPLGRKCHNWGWGCGIPSCNEEFRVDAVGVIQYNWVPIPPSPTPPSFVAMNLTAPLNVTGFNITAKNMTPLNLSLPFNIRMSDNPNCLTGNLDVDSSPAHWIWSVPISLQATTGVYQANIAQNIGLYPNVTCMEFDSPDPGVKWNIDSVGVFSRPPSDPPPSNCTKFNGNVTLSDLDGMCPTTAGPFINGVWSGDVIVPSPLITDTITAINPPCSGTSHTFDVLPVTGLSLVSFNTTEKYTHVLSIKIEGANENEGFNITTIPLYGDEPLRNSTLEQIGIINVVPNDYVLGFHQNVSGTYIYSQRDSVELNIPDNKSLGLHNFTFPFYDRFNNTFLPNYTIWLRQPTTTILNIETERDPSNINLTNVYVTAQLLFQRYDRPNDKPNIPLPDQKIEIYVQNSSITPYGMDGGVGHPLDPAGCNPANFGVCPNPAISGLTIEESNCSCPDWWDDPSNPGECIPNPGCRQYGLVANLTTNATGEINTSFKIYGFGRRLAFAVFWGTDVYAPSIDIKPFYAGGVSIGMGSFSMLEPILVIIISLALLTFERKFMLRT